MPITIQHPEPYMSNTYQPVASEGWIEKEQFMNVKAEANIKVIGGWREYVGGGISCYFRAGE